MKKLNAGGWIACIAAVLAIVAVVVYTINIGSAGYFQNSEVTNLVLCTILAAVALIAAIIIKNSSNGKAAELIAGILQIAAPATLAYSLINLISARVEGLGFIYFSNADVIKEVQTAENMTSARMAIASMIILGVAMLVGIIAAFCTIRKKEAK